MMSGLTVENLVTAPVGALVLDSDNEMWSKDGAGMWRQVGVFGGLGTSAFNSSRFRQGMGPVTTFQLWS